LRYQHGVFVPVGGTTGIEKAAQEMRAEEVFIELLRHYHASGRNVSHNKHAGNYAAALFANEAEAKKAQLRRKDFEAAMTRLFDKDKVVVESYGPPSKPASHLVEKGRQ
jgi:hypothetical protein